MFKYQQTAPPPQNVKFVQIVVKSWLRLSDCAAPFIPEIHGQIENSKNHTKHEYSEDLIQEEYFQAWLSSEGLAALEVTVCLCVCLSPGNYWRRI